MANGRGIPKMNVIAGDFDIVERPEDRFPPRYDEPRSIRALQRWLNQQGVTDIFKHKLGQDLEMTCDATNNLSMSRIDRVYADHTFMQDIRDLTLRQNND
jgi:hypothetical protein